jgi:hypothetical protein
MLWVALFSFLAHSTAVAQDDDCERLTSTGETRDCTFLEEARECVDDANDSFDDCMEDASEQEGALTRLINYAGCEAASFVNLTACAVSVTMDWGLGNSL